MVVLPSGIRPDLTPEDKEVKRRLGKCHPRAYSDMIKSDILGSSEVCASSSPLSRSFPLPAVETSPGGTLVVKPTQGELRAHVELLAKKKRSIKCKAQDPPEGSPPARGKVPKLGVSDPRSRAQVQVRGQAWSSSAEVSEVAGAQRHSSSAAGAKGSSRKASELPLKVLLISVWGPSTQNASPSPPTRGDVGDDRFGAEGGEDSLLTNAKLATGAVLSIFQVSNLRKVEALHVEEALALSLQGIVSVCRAPSFICLVVVLMLFANSFLFLGRRLHILRTW